MKYLDIAGNKVSEISLGCMRIHSLDLKEASKLINTAISLGINFFDHADIYGKGNSEILFSKAIDLKSSIREKIFIQSKCGIHNGYYDFSKEHILNSVDGSLKRLNTDYLDVLLLHRPDTLMEPSEVAEAFMELKKSGKVKYFGVSNQNPMQIELLNKYLNDKIIINQLQLSITDCPMIDCGLNVNTNGPLAINRDLGVLEYSRLTNITIQAWSPFQYGFFEGVYIDNDKFPLLNEKLDEIANKYETNKSAIVIAWILRHPAKMQPIVGTTKESRLKDICKASEISLTRREWYEIYKAAGKRLP